MTALVAGAFLLAVLAAGIWAVRQQNRAFPKGFDRTGWNSEPGHAGWFRTKFTWLRSAAGSSPGGERRQPRATRSWAPCSPRVVRASVKPAASASWSSSPSP